MGSDSEGKAGIRYSPIVDFNPPTTPRRTERTQSHETVALYFQNGGLHDIRGIHIGSGRGRHFRSDRQQALQRCRSRL
jgi:hypothetical protein